MFLNNIMLSRCFKKVSLLRLNSTSRNISVLSKNTDREYLFSSGALKFLDTFIENHKENHVKLLENRKLPSEYDFRKDTEWIRDDNTWSGPTIPDDLKCRHVEITGPSSNANMVINALNSNADCYMTDIEDSLSPTWDNIQNAHHNIYQSIRGELTSGDKKMKIKKSNPKRRKSFRARHNCKNPGPKWKARYWSCKAW